MNACVRDFVVAREEDVQPIRDANPMMYAYYRVQDSVIALRPFNAKRLPLSCVVGAAGPYILLTGRRSRYTVFIDDPFNNTCEPVHASVHALLYPLTRGAALQPFGGAFVVVPCIVPLARCTFVPHILHGTVVSAQKYFVPRSEEAARALLLSAVGTEKEIRHFDEDWAIAVREVTNTLVTAPGRS